MNKIDINIKNNLTPDEKELISILKEVIRKYTPSTIARFAGGWVRDRLLGKPSSDIDVMINNMSGADFARMVARHMGLKDPHVVKANPDASKHLETAGAAIPLSSGSIMDVDFAMARVEVYNDTSRIPEIHSATPQDDAMRRDLTINSLFYNINSELVEDFTGFGIKDLITNTMRTPMDPVKTFQDDPLRIFRTIRFAAKYNGNISPETYEAMQNPELKDAIKKKISKERIKDEMVKMFKGPNPIGAINIMKNTGLIDDIVGEAIKGTEYEGQMSPLNMNQNNPHHELNLWDHTMQVVKNILNQYPEADEEKRVMMILSAIMHDFGKLYNKIQAPKETQNGNVTTYHGHEDESAKISELILKYLKFENETISNVSKIVAFHMDPHQLVRHDIGKSTLRRFIRRMSEASINWMDVLNHAIADAYSKGLSVSPEIVNNYNSLKSQLEEAVQTMSMSKEKVIPVLNGNEIMQILNIKPGPYMKDITEFLKELQDENPNISKDEAQAKIIERFGGQFNKNTKKASIEVKSSTCPWNLVAQKSDDIKKLIENGNFHQSINIMESLIKEYSDDDRLAKMVARYMILILIEDPNQNNVSIIHFLMDRSQHNIFDGEMMAYIAGLLITVKTEADEKEVDKISNNANKMAPDIFSKILKSLPDKVFHQKIKNKYRKMVN